MTKHDHQSQENVWTDDITIELQRRNGDASALYWARIRVVSQNKQCCGYQIEKGSWDHRKEEGLKQNSQAHVSVMELGPSSTCSTGTDQLEEYYGGLKHNFVMAWKEQKLDEQM